MVAFSKRVARMGSHIFVILGVRKFRWEQHVGISRFKNLRWKSCYVPCYQVTKMRVVLGLQIGYYGIGALSANPKKNDSFPPLSAYFACSDFKSKLINGTPKFFVAIRYFRGKYVLKIRVHMAYQGGHFYRINSRPFLRYGAIIA